MKPVKKTISLKEYSEIPIIASIRYDPKKKSYVMTERGRESKRRGLIGNLKRTYYPTYVRAAKKYRKRSKKGSSEAQGVNVENQLTMYVAKRKAPTHRMAKAVLKYWKDHGHNPIAAQVPVYIDKFKCCTQADIITQTSDGQLWMNELKTGYPTAGFTKKGTFENLLEVPNTIYNQYHLQAYYTTKGMRDMGLNIKCVLIQVYDDKQKVVVKSRKQPKWIQQLELE